MLELAPLEEIKPLIEQLPDEPLIAYNFFCLYLSEGNPSVAVDTAVAAEYLYAQTGVHVAESEILSWAIKYDWEKRYLEAQRKIALRINKAFKYEESFQRQQRWERLADRKEKIEAQLAKLDERIDKEVNLLPIEDLTKFYTDLVKLQVQLGKSQREEKGEVTPQVTINIETVIERAALERGESREFIEAAKAAAMKQLYGGTNESVIEGDFKPDVA